LYGHRRHFDVQVDAIEQRSADLVQVPLDDGAGAAAFPGRIAMEAARAPVQISIDTV
jgi:hypothetical protein